ncbi:rCG30503, isoform CRA_b [Rattus norvegicus]|uniref:RCG30503, isoform CRA_b n=1 Tax=Rattus norvegicus TaxID=10116 RepID=A6JFA5_RAT|nr:rCG30503, isoform CRA_b [Rattus norvegicus]EDM11500.1 rCG30503, isoform CRA_b [Rattus norvegicus]EDM11502.1 rCG30503, isoform CRA_b [Rattus norvegicus]
MVGCGCLQWLSQVCLQAFYILPRTGSCRNRNFSAWKWFHVSWFIFSNVSRHAGTQLSTVFWKYRNCVSGYKYWRLSGSATVTKPSACSVSS